jgi:Phage stabilisation protein
MMMPIPLFGIGNQGKSLNVDAQQRTNLYIEVNASDPEKNTLTLYPTAGLTTFVNLGDTPVRGLYERGGAMFAVHKNNFYGIANNGTFTVLGTISTYTGRVSICDNGAQILIVDGQFGYIFTIATLTLTKITAPGFVASDTCTYINSRFVISNVNSGQFSISGQYDGLSWNALDFASAESDPDFLIRVISDSGLLMLFGDKTIEPWGDSGAQDFPFARIGGNAIEWGLAARWSLCKFMDSLIFLRKNRLGQVQICVHQAGAAQAVSTPEIDSVIGKYTATSDASAFAYMIGGHPFYQINFPSAGKSWLFDGQSKSWSQLVSDTGRHRAEIHTQFLGKNYVSDYANGKIYRLDEGVFTDDGVTIKRQFVSRHLSSGDYSSISALWIEMETGIGDQTGQGFDPQIMMRISKDGGRTYGAENWRSFGKVGEYLKRAIFNRLGRARDWVFEFTITDPVKTVITQAWGRKNG